MGGGGGGVRSGVCPVGKGWSGWWQRNEVIVKMQKKKVFIFEGGQGGRARRIEVIVKMQKKSCVCVCVGGGVVKVVVNEELKLL